ncbi:hypothetical protein HDU89_000563 [Geranomyces variabilis]|nr:hypothetical protein HDU89_000563 [Geranomyces variabilis]
MRAGLPNQSFQLRESKSSAYSSLQTPQPLYAHHAVLEGRQVVTQANGRLLLRSQSPENQAVTITILLHKSFVPAITGNYRTVHFLEGGIGLRDETGRALEPPGQRHGLTLQEGVIPRKKFKYHEQRDVIERIWDLERRRILGLPLPPALPPPLPPRAPAPAALAGAAPALAGASLGGLAGLAMMPGFPAFVGGTGSRGLCMALGTAISRRTSAIELTAAATSETQVPDVTPLPTGPVERGRTLMN